MHSLIFRTMARLLMPLLLLLAIFLLLRGHNEPGGGFVGGLVASSAFALYMLAYNVEEARRSLWIEPRLLIGLGLLLMVGSGAAAMWIKKPFLSGIWFLVSLPVADHVEIGTPFIFDISVFLVVLGAVLTIVFSLAEEE